MPPLWLSLNMKNTSPRRNVPWLTADPTSSVNFTPLHELNTITPNGLCFERHHGGVAIIDQKKYRFMINGLVDQNIFIK